jgi:dipeptidyl aminopeptidase/acylaminoacyl peptidase
VQSLDEAPSLWAEDVKSSRRVQLWNPNPQLAGKVSGASSVYHWLDKDKREWSGELILPHGFRQGGRYPLVIQTHGFRPKEFLVDGAWATANAARPLAAAGFVVLQIDDNHDHFQTAEEVKIHVNGFMAAIDQLAESGTIDPRRVGIIGFSRTCWYVEESLIESPGRFAAAVIADGVDQSYVQYLLRRPELQTWESERYNGGIPISEGLVNWLKYAPGFRLSELKTPLRIQAITPYGLLGEWETYASLKIQNKPVDMLYLPLGQHVLQNPAERMASEQGDVDWFRFWLKGEEDHDPAKRAQYERWEMLRKRESR